VAAALQHRASTQLVGVRAPGTGNKPALFVLFGYASENKQGWLKGYVNTNLTTGTYRGGRSPWASCATPKSFATLGDSKGPVDLEVFCPDGVTQIVADVAVDQMVTVTGP